MVLFLGHIEDQPIVVVKKGEKLLKQLLLVTPLKLRKLLHEAEEAPGTLKEVNEVVEEAIKKQDRDHLAEKRSKNFECPICNFEANGKMV